MYYAACRIHLPFTEVTKERGDTVTKKELEDAQQGPEQVKELVEGGTLLTKEEYDASVTEEEKEARKAQIAALRAQADAMEKEE